MPKLVSDVLSHWQHPFASLNLSSDEFYKAVEEEVRKKEIEGIRIFRENLYQSGLLSAKREYLAIAYKEYVLHVCAAPFGPDFFVSTWLSETTSVVREILLRIPVINWFVARARTNKTYYQADTEQMVKGCIHSAVRKAIDKITEEKGVRGLSDLEKQSSSMSFQKGLPG